jgi:hypothetical protein
MSFYLDIKLPIGFRVKAEYRKFFSGSMRSLLVCILRDLEKGGLKNTSYFLKERISTEERKVLIALLRSIEEEHEYKLEVSNEALQENTVQFEPYIRQVLRRYK